jgi:hypothetical protein
MNDNRLSAGSLEGAGNYYLGSNTLTVGSNNLSGPCPVSSPTAASTAFNAPIQAQPAVRS